MYNLGLILKQEGKVEAAMDTLYRAVWNYNYNSAGNFQLAQLYVAQGDIPMALERLDEAIAPQRRQFQRPEPESHHPAHTGRQGGRLGLREARIGDRSRERLRRL